MQNLIRNSWGKHKVNQHHDGDLLNLLTSERILMNIGFYTGCPKNKYTFEMKPLLEVNAFSYYYAEPTGALLQH